MKSLPIIVSLGFVAIAGPMGAQNSSTNLLTKEQVVKLASRLHLGMREEDVTAVLKNGGLKCNLKRAGDGFLWHNDCDLAQKRTLVLEFHNSPGQCGRWEQGLLSAAFITTWTGERVSSITLTNAP